jgi:putative heme utilization carrier protein HutX
MGAAIEVDKINRVREALGERLDGVLEVAAAQFGMPLQAVIECLPAGMWTRIPGDHFIDVVRDVSDWGETITIVHTRDVVLEFNGRFPGGSNGHGFYNLKGDGGISGHLRHGNCRAIVFLRRPFMGMDTLSIQFMNADGDAMFKIFVGRDERRRLKADQVERFARLERRYAATATA